MMVDLRIQKIAVLCWSSISRLVNVSWNYKLQKRPGIKIEITTRNVTVSALW
jgi:hypothetical protein